MIEKVNFANMKEINKKKYSKSTDLLKYKIM